MRTQWGVDLDSIRRQFGREYRDYLLQQAKTSINHGYIVQNGHNLVLSDEGKFISDTIFCELMWTEDE
jgi:oxygen-independent coproporphyrinogen-3 oxidase